MQKFGESQTIKRVEDSRFLTGTGAYVDDLAPAHALHAVFFRSPVAHAEITGLDVSAARDVPGVALVLTAEDLEAAGVVSDIPAAIMRNLDGSRGVATKRPFLASGRVRFVGQPIAMVVAETANAAKEAAELIEFDYEELDASLNVAPGGPAIYEAAPDNVAFDWGLGDADATDAALAASAHRVKLDVADNRIIVNSMEPRGAFAEWTEDGRVHLCYGGQGVWGMKDRLSKALKIKPDQVRVTTPDVGGGFGMKGFTYPEYYMVAIAAREVGKPVRWFAERTEAMLSDNAGRDLTSLAEIGFDENLKITAYRVDSMCNLGAYNSEFAQAIQTDLFAKVYAGTYDIQTAYLSVKGIFTNTTQVDAYRGAGRPEAIYVLERVMDYAARELGVDPWELRRRNFIKPDAFPYETVVGEVYDVGEFDRVMTRAADAADVDGFAARKADSAVAGKLRGLGVCYYIESILGDPTEGAAIEFNDDGTVNLYVGTQSNGQGHETVYAQFLADQSGLPMDAIRIVQGDSDRIKSGGGTGGSRSVTVQSTATLATIDTMITTLTPYVAAKLDVPEDTVTFDDGHFRSEHSNQTPDLMEVAAMARNDARPELLRHDGKATLPGRSYPNGCHIAEMEIDPDTGTVEVAKYTVTDDFGNLIHPMLAEGQVHGGVAQGIGQALTEHVVFDESGQLLTATFMDYGMPRADNVPMIAFYTETIPSKNNPMGMKGCGEAGTVGALAAVANGVLDAVWETGLRQVDMPFTPHRMWQMLHQTPLAAE
ncbi:xanthine dehydrogenase family protein molybdopterin-binding subunit [Actibacterium sp. 188UL27-1]|uniref:xanthine dehydrogenase family protein molybdopterin-binding subunit n=1 Tax=Actibacterium sp. 188UL27-1 TaxID=2786961 RepID=UPI00195D467F|nr:xanthine dehydrogenase family protein molybdopterin-binding subunit [Actibacterium sp. 188UL27-1]MBM7068670.1 xanthine dehydrogenase family protein molybdopterin-binding subunit [Actibacterium sp. 188UL27-1]